MTSHLTREQKIELIALREEKARREILKRPTFTPTAAQDIVVRSKALERYLFCANAFGKSALLVNELHWAATGYNPVTKETTNVPAKICLLIDSPEKISDFLDEYRKWNVIEPDQLHKKGKPNFSFITYPNGSTVTVLTHEVNPLRLEGSQWTHVFCDEPPPRTVFLSIFRGGRIKGHPMKTFLAGTPITAAWMRTEVYDPWTKGELPHVECFRGSTEDNRVNLEEGYIERFSKKLNEREKEIRLHGQFFDLEGLALSHLFKRHTHTIDRADLDWDRNNPCVIVVDCHPTKPHHAIVVGVNKDNHVFVLEEYKEKSVARKFAKSLIGKEWFSRYRILDVVYDSLGNSETTSGEGFLPFGTVFNEVLDKHGLGRARATSYEEKSDEDFITRIQDALLLPEEPNNFGQLVPKLRIVSDCIGTIGDIENVSWAKRHRSDENKPFLDISHKDFLSCLKYGLATNLYHSKTKDKAYYYTKPAYGFNVAPPAHGKIRFSSHHTTARRPSYRALRMK